MILTAETIRTLVEDNLLQIDPFRDAKTKSHGMSYGLSHAGYDIRIDIKDNNGSLTLWPGDFALVTVKERIRLPTNIMMFVHDKSSWARRGLSAFNTVFEPGWSGYATLELINHSRTKIVLDDGMPIVQCIFHQLDGHANAYAGKYQNQEQRPVAAIAHADRLSLRHAVSGRFPQQNRLDILAWHPGVSDQKG